MSSLRLNGWTIQDGYEVHGPSYRQGQASCATGPWQTEPPGEDVPDDQRVLWSYTGIPVTALASTVRKQWDRLDVAVQSWARINPPKES